MRTTVNPGRADAAPSQRLSGLSPMADHASLSPAHGASTHY